MHARVGYMTLVDLRIFGRTLPPLSPIFINFQFVGKFVGKSCMTLGSSLSVHSTLVTSLWDLHRVGCTHRCNLVHYTSDHSRHTTDLLLVMVPLDKCRNIILLPNIFVQKCGIEIKSEFVSVHLHILLFCLKLFWRPGWGREKRNCWDNGAFPKCFQWIRWNQWQKYLITVKGLKLATQPPLV